MAAKPAPRPKAPGRNIEEWQRKGLKVQFRLPELAGKELERRAKERECTPNALALIYVFDLLRSAEPNK